MFYYSTNKKGVVGMNKIIKKDTIMRKAISSDENLGGTLI